MSTVEFPVGRGQVALVDEEDWEHVKVYDWYCFRVRHVWYVATDRIKDGRAKRTYLHQFIMNAPPKSEVDHINNNGLDNRRQNLRIVSHQQNLANQKLSEANTSGYKGVTLDRRTKKDGTPLTPAWMAQTKYNGKRIYLGKFSSPEAAARAYDRKMLELHGEHAKTNESLGLLSPDDGQPLIQNMHLGGQRSGKSPRQRHKQTIDRAVGNSGQRYIYPNRKGWMVRLVQAGEKIYLGTYPTITEAQIARDHFLQTGATEEEATNSSERSKYGFL